jgi:glyoxylase-like metal-dependent hydrolase (beta-lactamase superfamily II)
MSLPSPVPNQAFCDVSALEAGLIGLLDEMFITNAVPGKVTTAPSLAFLIRHSEKGGNFVFDLGIRKDWQNYPPRIVDWIKKVYPVTVEQDVAESIIKGGTSLTDVDHVCLSHIHFDHSGNTHPFTKSTFLVGGSAQTLIKPGYPQDPNAYFDSGLLPEGRTKYLDASDWKPIGPFPRALDFFGDGSLYIVDAPGHLPGHINALARTSPDGGWIFLAGDSAHYWSLITGESEIPVGHPCHVNDTAHASKELAEEHISRIRALWKLPRVQILLAHDTPWYEKHKGGDSFWPGKIESL